MLDFAFLVQSYRADFEFAQRMIESFRRHNSDSIPMFLLVSTQDAPLFEPLGGGAVTVVVDEPLSHHYADEGMCGLLPGYINQEIAKVLTNLTNFEVLFEEDGNKLDIFIKHPKHDPRPLSMASGAEKTMAAMAIRLAFLAVSNLPTSDIMVLDEPGTALDEEHLQAFTQLLDMIKVHFKTTLLISHLDSLKDIVDLTLDISKKEGYAYINQ